MNIGKTVRALTLVTALVTTLLAALVGLLAPVAGEAGAQEVTAPDTYIMGSPAPFTNKTTATFTFYSPEPGGARFECSLDGGAFRSCKSPIFYAGLAEGRHVFKVRGIDAAGNADRTPVTRSWTVVDDRAPVVTIEGAPRIESYHEYHHLKFSTDVPGSSFFCSLDDEPFAPCKSGEYRCVSYDVHTFSVYAMGPGGKRGETSISEYESRDPGWD